MRRASTVGGTAVMTRNGRIAFVLGGGFLVGAAIIGAVQWGATPWGESTAFRALDAGGSALFAAGLLVFAIGVRRDGSVVSRRPVGAVALVLFGILPLFAALGMALLSMPGEGGAVGTAASLLILATYTAPIAGAVAVVAIVRARAVPGRWRWLPSIVFVVGCIVIAYAFWDGISVGGDYGGWGVIVVYLVVSRLLLGGVAIGLALHAGSTIDAERSGDPGDR